MPSSTPPTLRLCLIPAQASDNAPGRVVQAIYLRLNAVLIQQGFAVVERTADVDLYLLVDEWSAPAAVHLPEPVPQRVSVIVKHANREIFRVTVQQRPRFWRRPKTPDELAAALAAKLAPRLRAQ